ncbi:hypothetical protein SADUNF_Sadunf10G0119700 [Salix dunnii]|uniref:X8 domain-containing protein n=1 Tax=Salix dunnii TaxID=1413687 RepID=A0A835JTI0_9ROSI|nr:hypothetical protein SADUNF_Sadunf10G0119700 [Salix dunnii]
MLHGGKELDISPETTQHSSDTMCAPTRPCATYCVCKDGVSDAQLQKSLDYACGAGADCSQVLQNGPCYQPNTVKDHCSYAVNSYFQKKGQATGSCDFSGTAMTSATPPQNVASGCSYPASATSRYCFFH